MSVSGMVGNVIGDSDVRHALAGTERQKRHAYRARNIGREGPVARVGRQREIGCIGSAQKNGRNIQGGTAGACHRYALRGADISLRSSCEREASGR